LCRKFYIDTVETYDIINLEKTLQRCYRFIKIIKNILIYSSKSDSIFIQFDIM